MYPIIIHIPHSAVFIPEEIKENFLIVQNELEYELLVMTDWYTDELFRHPKVGYQKSTVSRLVFDPERFRDDEMEPMAERGMGVVYTRTSSGSTLMNATDEYKERILHDYYDVYHELFNNKVDSILYQYNKCLIIDAHSFPSKPLPYETMQSLDRPDICIGVDDYFTPQELVFETEELMSKSDLKCAINNPFSGSFITSKHYTSRDSRVKSIMIELNRGLYMDEATGKKNKRFHQIGNLINDLIEKLTKSF